MAFDESKLQKPIEVVRRYTPPEEIPKPTVEELEKILTPVVQEPLSDDERSTVEEYLATHSEAPETTGFAEVSTVETPFNPDDEIPF